MDSNGPLEQGDTNADQSFLLSKWAPEAQYSNVTFNPGQNTTLSMAKNMRQEPQDSTSATGIAWRDVPHIYVQWA